LENAFSLIDPQINAEGVHVWPFDPAFPPDIRFYVWDKRHNIRTNRHDYFEIFYLHAGELVCRIQDREFKMREGDLAVISSTQYHTIQFPEKRKASGPVRAAALYFLPELIRASDASGDDSVQSSNWPRSSNFWKRITRNRFRWRKRLRLCI